MKKYYFSSRFFSCNDMIIYFHFHTSRSVKNKVNWSKTQNITCFSILEPMSTKFRDLFKSELDFSRDL